MNHLERALQSRPPWMRNALLAAGVCHADLIIEYTQSDVVDHVRRSLVKRARLHECLFNGVVDELESLHRELKQYAHGIRNEA